MMLAALLVVTLGLYAASSSALLLAGFRRKRRLWVALGGSLLLMTVPLTIKLYEAVLVGAAFDSEREYARLAFAALGVGLLLALLLDRERITRQLKSERSALARLEVAADEFRTSSLRYELAALGAHDGLWSLELSSGRMFFSARYCALLGLPVTESTFDDWLALIHLEDVATVRDALEAHVTGSTETFECEHRMRHTDGRVLWVRSRGTARRDAAGRAQQVAGSMSDITQRRMSAEHRARAHVEDPLTGLATRVVLVERITESIARARDNAGYRFAVLAIDMDRFSIINTSFGQRSGDQLLVATARKLEARVAAGDLVARIGGDKFGVLLEDVGGVERVTSFADQVLNEIEAPVHVGRHQVCASGSIGIALSTMSYADPDDVLRDADIALGRARELGGGCYQLFDAHLKSRVRDRIDVETELLRGVVQDQFRLCYQPIVSLTTGRIHGFEALLRWWHPRRGLISPEEFIPIAEANGTIVVIGRWVLGNACHQIKRWRERFGTELPLSINVNISASQFRHPRLVEDVVAVLEETGIDAADLKIEITENVLMQNQDDVSRVLGELKAHGIGLCIDDFGTGYSSLGYLSHFPLDTLKIDRSFVSELDSKPESVELVRTILQLGKNLGMRVVAEGVESREQLAKLRELGCDFAQGFFFGKPADEPLATRLIEREVETLDVPLGRVARTSSTSLDAGAPNGSTETANVSSRLKDGVLG